MKRIFYFISLMFILSTTLISCGGGEKEQESQEIDYVAIINKSIEDYDFAKAYNLIDSMGRNERLNDKALTSEIIYWIGSDADESQKATRIILAIKERSKYNVFMYDPTRNYKLLEELKCQTTYFDKAIEITKSLDQKTLLQKLQNALNNTQESYQKIEKEEEKRKAQNK